LRQRRAHQRSTEGQQAPLAVGILFGVSLVFGPLLIAWGITSVADGYLGPPERDLQTLIGTVEGWKISELVSVTRGGTPITRSDPTRPNKNWHCELDVRVDGQSSKQLKISGELEMYQVSCWKKN
jgi:hypothetical protein